MILTYKKGDVLTRILEKNGKFVITKYETLNDSITIQIGIGDSTVNVPLKMIYTNDEDQQLMLTEKRYMCISTIFTDDGVEKRKHAMGDLFIIGDKEETINKAKGNILFENNMWLRENYLIKNERRYTFDS